MTGYRVSTKTQLFSENTLQLNFQLTLRIEFIQHFILTIKIKARIIQADKTSRT